MEVLTQILRAGNPRALEADLIALLNDGEAEWMKDDRDLMVALAPHHDCARRLDADVPELFRRAAAAGPASLRAVVERFGTQTDILPERWGFEVVSTPDGPLYRWDDVFWHGPFSRTPDDQPGTRETQHRP